MTGITTILAAATPQAPPFWHPSSPMFLMIVMFAIFYFVLIAPMRKKQKKHAEMLQSLKNGDRVITNGGIHGTVVGVADNLVKLRIDDQVKIDVSKSAVAAFQNRDS